MTQGSALRADLAMRYVPEFGTDFPAGLLPAEWLARRGLGRS